MEIIYNLLCNICKFGGGREYDMKIDRLFSIVQILINKKIVTAGELAEYFDVSVRTIYKDIDTLSSNGIPIYCLQGKGGEISKRKIESYKLIFKGHQWYVYGFCRMRNEFRFFKLTRIDDLTILDDIFDRREDIAINTKYNIDNYEMIKVKLKINSRMAARVYDEFRKEKIIFDGEYSRTPVQP